MIDQPSQQRRDRPFESEMDRQRKRDRDQQGRQQRNRERYSGRNPRAYAIADRGGERVTEIQGIACCAEQQRGTTSGAPAPLFQCHRAGHDYAGCEAEPGAVNAQADLRCKQQHDRADRKHRHSHARPGRDAANDGKAIPMPTANASRIGDV
jgi:hypothetical protein